MRSFTSTRGSDAGPLEEVLFRGLARDGGLYVPTELTDLPDPPSPSASADFVATARWAAPYFFPEVPTDVLARVVTRSLTFPIPLIEVEPGAYVLELFHGPTCAFKDVGARFMAHLAAALDPGDRARTVLVATSGDTGGAVAEAFHDLEAFRVVVLFPQAGVSSRQRRQMTTLGGNVTALAVAGSFDDCQRLVKEAFLDAELHERHALTSANSINVGRLLPQGLYYVYAAIALGWDRGPARFVVPSGNLGNLSAGLMARRMGMPAAGFVAAANLNRGFVDFLAGAAFEARASISTASSAMDVGNPSNLERLLWLYHGDAESLRRDVVGVSVTDAAVRGCMEETYARTGYVLDPHSAVAYEAHRRHHDDFAGPSVVLATADPAKFPEVVESVIGRELPLPAGLARNANAEEHMRDVPPTLDALSAVLDEATG